MKDELSNQLPSFAGHYAVVYNDYMDTLGGGERSALAFALALEKMDFHVEILSTRPVPSAEQINRIFGDEFSGLTVRHVKTSNVSRYLQSSELSLFLNHTYMSFHSNPARVGLYSLMFPNYPISSVSDPKAHRAINSYQGMICNSSFTKNYLEGFWEFPKNKSYVLHPPLSRSFIEHKAPKQLIARKRQQFVHIGRFNPGNHNKNQKLIIEGFIEALSREQALKNWQLVLIGNVNETEESKAYFQDCQRIASRFPENILIRHGVDQAELVDQLKSAFGYIHGTGAFLAPGVEPHKCEHFGIGIAEAMAFGAIPLVYARGGIFDILDPYENGLVYLDQEGLVDGYCELAQLYADQAKAWKVQQKTIAATESLSHDSFTANLSAIIAEALYC